MMFDRASDDKHRMTMAQVFKEILPLSVVLRYLSVNSHHQELFSTSFSLLFSRSSCLSEVLNLISLSNNFYTTTLIASGALAKA